MPVLLDSYVEANQDNHSSIQDFFPYQVGYNTVAGQSFKTPNDGLTRKLLSVKFYMTKIGSPVGNMTARLHTHSGTYGESSKPANSSILATSDVINANTLTGSYVLVEFSFTGAQRVALQPNTAYCIGVGYVPSGTLDNTTNYIKVGLDVSTPSHAGNDFGAYSDTWYEVGSNDLIFYVYGSAGAPTVTIEADIAELEVNENCTITASVQNGEAPLSYKWYVETVEQQGEVASTFVFTKAVAGTYTVKCVVTDALSQTDDSNELEITFYSALDVTIAPTSDTVEPSEEVVITASPSGGKTPCTYKWFVDTVEQTGETSITFGFSDSEEGEYAVTCQVKDALNNTDLSNTSTITVEDTTPPAGGIAHSIDVSPIDISPISELNLIDRDAL